MPNKMELLDVKFRTPCDAFMCHDIATVNIGQSDAPASTYLKLCPKHLDDLVESIHENHPANSEHKELSVDEIIPYLKSSIESNELSMAELFSALGIPEQLLNSNDIEPKQDEVKPDAPAEVTETAEPTNEVTETQDAESQPEQTVPDHTVFPKTLEVPRPEDVENLAWQDMRKWAKILEIENYQSLNKEELVPLLKQELQNAYDEAMKGTDGE